MGGLRRLRSGIRDAVSRRFLLGAFLAVGILLATAGSLLGTLESAVRDPQRPAVNLEFVAGGLESPIDLGTAPGDPDTLYVGEQTGRIRVLRDGVVEPDPFLDVRDLVVARGEQGLLGFAFHPAYERNRRLYVHYTNRDGDTRVVEYRSNGALVLPHTRRVLLAVEQPYENHNGGQIAFGPDGRLYLGLGDGGSAFDPGARAQDMSSLLGKLLRLDVDRPGAPPEIVAYGLRNPWRFAFDPEGNLFIADVGQDRWEEVNVLASGERGLVNFGWNVFEGRERVGDEPLNGAGRLAWPIAAYRHAGECTSITGGRVYSGRQLPSLRGRYVYGDYCSGAVWSLRWRAGGRAEVRREPVELSAVTTFGEGADGELYVASQGGTVYRLAGAL